MRCKDCDRPIPDGYVLPIDHAGNVVQVCRGCQVYAIKRREAQARRAQEAR
jgi:ribosome-binding protein aMBF1 (putative translation factor)